MKKYSLLLATLSIATLNGMHKTASSMHLLWAAQGITYIEKLLRSPEDLRAHDMDLGTPLLHVAAMYGSKDLIIQLKKRGVTYNQSFPCPVEAYFSVPNHRDPKLLEFLICESYEIDDIQRA